MKKNTPHNTQNGNALFFILIAVVLLGLLTMIVSRSGSSVEQTGDFERNSVQASQILRYAKSFEAAIQQMKLRDISENEISFENGITATDYTNTNCDEATDRNFPSCMLFDVEGAGLTYRNFPSANDGSDWTFTAVYNVGSTNGPVGETANVTGNDILMILRNVNSELCSQINRQLNIGNAGTFPRDNDFFPVTEFTGSFPSGLTILEGSDPATAEFLNGKTAGCFIDGNANVHFYQVILAR